MTLDVLPVLSAQSLLDVIFVLFKTVNKTKKDDEYAHDYCDGSMTECLLTNRKGRAACPDQPWKISRVPAHHSLQNDESADKNNYYSYPSPHTHFLPLINPTPPSRQSNRLFRTKS